MAEDHTIVAVRTDTINYPQPHEHPILLRDEDDHDWTPGDIIEYLDKGDRFYVALDGEIEGMIHVHPCPNCGSDPYLCGGAKPEFD